MEIRNQTVQLLQMIVQNIWKQSKVISIDHLFFSPFFYYGEKIIHSLRAFPYVYLSIEQFFQLARFRLWKLWNFTNDNKKGGYRKVIFNLAAFRKFFSGKWHFKVSYINFDLPNFDLSKKGKILIKENFQFIVGILFELYRKFAIFSVIDFLNHLFSKKRRLFVSREWYLFSCILR